MADSPANPRITKEVMEQFERLRKRDVVNINDLNAVYTAAEKAGMKQLAELISTDFAIGLKNSAYLEIIKRREFYLKKHKLGAYRKVQ